MGEMNSMAIDDCIGAIQLAGGPSLPPLFQDLDIQAPRLVISDSMTMGQAWAAQVIKAMPLLEGRLERVLSASSGIYPAAESRSIDGWKDTVERRSHRGTAGVLRDTIDTSAAGNDWLIVLEASACPAVELGHMIESFLEHGGIHLGISELDRYAGVMILPVRLMSVIPEVGFFDLKEQFLNECIRRGETITGVTIARRAIRVHDRESVLLAVSEWGKKQGEKQSTDSGAKTQGFCAIAPTAKVLGATIVSSVILPGAVVEPEAVVARSIIGSNQRVRSGRVVSDRVISTRPTSRRREAGR